MRPPSCLGDALRIAAVFDRDINVRSDDTGWTINCVDRAHISMVGMTVPASAFEDYRPLGDFSVRIDDIKTLLPRTEDIDVSDGLFIMKGKGWKRSMSISFFEEGRKPNPMEMPYTALFDVELIKPAIGLFDSKKIGEVVFRMSPEGLRLELADKTDSMETTVSAEDMVDLDMPEGEIRAAYALDYWQDFVKALPRSTLIELGFDTDYPAAVDFDIGGITGRWLIAPRIEGD